MCICIICKEDKELTDEHIVPEFLGGGLITKSVCKNCNDKMGNTFEGRLSNCEIFSLPNFINQVKGKSGKIPNPLAGNKRTKEGEKVRVEFIDNKFKVKKHPEISIEETEEGDLFSLSIDPSDYGQAEKIIKAKIDRYYPDISVNHRQKLSQKLYEDLLNSQIIESNPPIIHGSFTINFKDMRLLFAKIAYEIGFFHFGYDFIKEPIADRLRETLFTQEEKDIQVILYPKIEQLSDLFQDKKHYIYLSRNFCYIRLYDITAIVIVSELHSTFDINSEYSIIYEFSYTDRTYVKRSLSEHVDYLNMLSVQIV